MPKGVPSNPALARQRQQEARARRAREAEAKRLAQFPHQVAPACDIPPVDQAPDQMNLIAMTPELASDLRVAAFVLEAVAHAQGMAREYCPVAHRLREAAAHEQA